MYYSKHRVLFLHWKLRDWLASNLAGLVGPVVVRYIMPLGPLFLCGKRVQVVLRLLWAGELCL